MPPLVLLGNHSKQPDEQGNLASHISFGNALELSFPDHVHGLESLQRSPSCLEGEEAYSGFRQAFDEAVVLLDEVIEILDWSQFYVCRQDSSSFSFSYRLGIRSILINIDDTKG
jgi:hypothetical protein